MARDAEIGTVTVGVVPDATGIEQKLRDQIVPGAERVGEEAGQEMSDKIEEKMTKGGDKSAARFETSFKTRLKKALDNLPEAKIDGDVSDVERKLAEIRLEIKAIQEAPLIDKAQTAANLDSIMLKVAQIKDEAASVDVNISDQAKIAITQLETSLAKIRGKAITGALVPGGMFSRIPFGATPKVTVVAAPPEVTRHAVEVAGETMDDIFNEFRALQAAKDKAAAAVEPVVRKPSFAGVPLVAGEAIGDISGATAPARARMFAAGTSGMADIIHSVIGEVITSASPWGNAAFIAGMGGIKEATYSMSKEVELFRKPVTDLVRIERSAVARISDSVIQAAIGRAAAAEPAVGKRPSFAGIPLEYNEIIRDLTEKPGTQARMFAAGRSGMAEIIQGAIREAVPTTPWGGAGFVFGVNGVEKAAFSMSKEVELFRKPTTDLVRYSETLGGYSKELVRLEKSAVTTTAQDIVRGTGFSSRFFSMIARGLGVRQPAGLLGTWMGRAGFGPGAVDVATGAASTAYTSMGNLLAGGGLVRGRIVGPTSAQMAALQKAAEKSGANSQTAKIVNTTLSRVMASWIKGIFTSADKMPKTSLITDDLVRLESRLKSGLPLSGDLAKFANFIKSLEKQKKDVSNIGDLLLQFGQGGGSIGGVLTGAGVIPGGAAGGGGGASILSGAAPWVIGGIVAASPFIAQIIAGAVTSGIGLGMAGLTFAGALQNPGIKKEFTSVGKQFSQVLGQSGEQFVPGIQTVLKDMSKTMKILQPFFSAASAIISIPMTKFLDTIVTSLATPQVQKAIEAIAIAFAKILDAITPDVAGGMSSLADSVTRLADEVAKNPKAFADFINFIFQLAIGITNLTAALTGFANFLEQGKFGKNIAAISQFFYQLFDPNSPLNKGDPKVFATIKKNIKTTFGDIGGFFTGVGRGINGWLAGGFSRELTHFENWLWGIGKDIVKGIFHGIDLAMAAGGNWVYNHFVKPFVDFFTSMQYGFGTASPSKRMEPIGEDIVNGIWQGILNVMKSVGTWIYAHIYQPIVSGINSAFSIVGHTANSMIGIGMSIVQGLYQGIVDALTNIATWIDKNVYQPVVQAIINKFKIGSPAKAMIPLGKQIVQGIIHGIISEGKNITGFISDVFGGWPQALGRIIQKGIISLGNLPVRTINMLYGLGTGAVGAAKKAWNSIFGGFLGPNPNVTGNVSRWTSTVNKALSLLKLPSNLVSRILYQIQTESGGNPRAINLTDANAKRGDPSRGLLQTIGSTFAGYHVPGTSWNIYDPLANIAAAVNYASHMYGPSLMRGGVGIGSGHGYDYGGWLPTGVTMAVNNTGRPELVLTADQASALGGGPEYHAHFDGLTGQAIQAEVRTAFHMMSLTQGHLGRPGRRS